MQLIILSAGKGSRLPKKFRDKPKCLVEIKSKPLLFYNSIFFKKFKDKILIAGYKNHHLKKVSESLDLRIIVNKKFASTNMVYSLFLANKFVKQDVVVIYGDIIFNNNIFEILNEKKDILPVNTNWLKNWKNRMPLRKVLEDAENLIVSKNKLLEIGTKIDNKFPKYQFMGIIKFKKNTFFKCEKFFKKIKNRKIDMTSFINLCVKKKIMSPMVKKYSDFWYEIDTISDHKYTEKEIKKW